MKAQCLPRSSINSGSSIPYDEGGWVSFDRLGAPRCPLCSSEVWFPVDFVVGHAIQMWSPVVEVKSKKLEKGEPRV